VALNTIKLNLNQITKEVQVKEGGASPLASQKTGRNLCLKFSRVLHGISFSFSFFFEDGGRV
jgi:hypothetical protein